MGAWTKKHNYLKANKHIVIFPFANKAYVFDLLSKFKSSTFFDQNRPPPFYNVLLSEQSDALKRFRTRLTQFWRETIVHSKREGSAPKPDVNDPTTPKGKNLKSWRHLNSAKKGGMVDEKDGSNGGTFSFRGGGKYLKCRRFQPTKTGEILGLKKYLQEFAFNKLYFSKITYNRIE